MQKTVLPFTSIQWWEADKVQIKVFTQRCSVSFMTATKRTFEKLEKDIENLDEVTPHSPKQLGRAKKCLDSFLQD